MGGASCKAKIILDGASAAGYAEALCEVMGSLSEKDTAKLTDEVAYPIIDCLIDAEVALEKAHNMLLDAMAYDGPRP